ncbi:MAG TPA: MarR family transcriptional regulator [Longimicrobiales bacterium]|nr:MarR family transcriptional regulator [Longimicrobiales bacterium]
MRNYIDRTTGARKARSALERDAAALYGAMTELLRVYQFRDRDRVGYHGLTITQSYVLEVLLRRGPITLNELVAELLLDKSTLSRVVDALEGKQALKRIANPADGRSILLEVTASGKRRYERVEMDIVAENARVLSGFSAATRGQLVTLIEELAQAARERQITEVDESAV